MLNTSAHVHHVLHELLNGRIFNGHVGGSHCNHKIQSWDDVACILDELVKVGQVVDRVVFAKMNRQVSQGVEHRHVQLVVLLGSKTACAKLRNQSRATRVSDAIQGAELSIAAIIYIPAFERIH
jgi:hypothetical protein